MWHPAYWPVTYWTGVYWPPHAGATPPSLGQPPLLIPYPLSDWTELSRRVHTFAEQSRGSAPTIEPVPIQLRSWEELNRRCSDLSETLYTVFPAMPGLRIPHRLPTWLELNRRMTALSRHLLSQF